LAHKRVFLSFGILASLTALTGCGTAYEQSHSYIKASPHLVVEFENSIYNKNEKAVKIFLKEGINPNQNVTVKSILGVTLKVGDQYTVPFLLIAAILGETSIVKDMLNAGANPNSHDQALTPLFIAAQDGYKTMLQDLLADGANPNVSQTRPSIAETYLSSNPLNSLGVAVPSFSEQAKGYTALFDAAAGPNWSLSSTRALLAAHANPNDEDTAGDSPLVGVLNNDQRGGFLGLFQRPVTAEIHALLNAGATPDAQDSSGNTPLMIAAAAGDNESVQILINAGTNLSIKNSSGDTALDVAQNNGYNQIANLILQAQQQQNASG